MDAREFVASDPDFARKNHPKRIKAFGWFLHVHEQRERFNAGDIRRCYDVCDLNQPANMARFLESLSEKTPPELLHDAGGYRLSQPIRGQLEREYGGVDSVVTIERMLADLPGKLSDEGERVFLVETLLCYRYKAYRAAIVMVWNLAFDHLLRWVLADPGRLMEFNAGIAKRNPSKAKVVIDSRDDFEDLKEDEIIDIVGHVSGISNGLKRLLKEKLGRRNTYAHPSLLHVERAQVDDMITDLINNVVLVLPLYKRS